MQSDAVKLWITYLTAVLIVAGGGAMLWFSRLDPPETSAQLQLVVAGFIGGAIQFLFNRETQTQTTRATERGIAQGAASTSLPPLVTPEPLP